jgi:hypothetical protein
MFVLKMEGLFSLSANEVLVLILTILMVVVVFLYLALSKDDPDAPKLSLAAMRMIRYDIELEVGDKARREGKRVWFDFKGRPHIGNPPRKGLRMRYVLIMVAIFYGCYIVFLYMVGLIWTI